MIALFSVLALAEPGRVTATGWATAAVSAPGPQLHGAVDYGVIRHLALGGQGSLGPRGPSVAVGPRFDVVDSDWWRVGLHVLPGVVAQPGHSIAPALQVGGQVSWLAFWGVSFVVRADKTLAQDGGPLEIGGGLAVRM